MGLFFRKGQIVVTHTSWSEKWKFRVLLFEKTREPEGNLDLELSSGVSRWKLLFSNGF